MPTTTTKVPKVEKTKDYHKFQYIMANRNLNRGHIENLKKAFEDKGNITANLPLIVNERMEVIDGQHRLRAVEELHLPAYYIVVPGLNIGDAREMNILQKTWDVMDFAESYAATGDKNYARYIVLREDYGFSHTATLMAAIGEGVKGLVQQFRRGEFVLTNEAEAREKLEKLAEAREVIDFRMNDAFAAAYLKAMRAEGFDQKRMIQKLKLNIQLLHRAGSVDDYLHELESIYNYKVAEANRVRLF